ncbi:MAG: histidine phosphatase family protein [Clostridia bacterium]|nr:histidine phosphatase family protein [Clostridia bacterium]
MKIMYCHHGNRKVNGKPTQDDELTDIGINDCENVSQLLEIVKHKENIKCIYTSQFFRCKKTAQLINSKINVPIKEDKRLDEFKSVKNETWEDCQNRVTDLLKEIIKTYNEDDFVICVTSGVNIAGFLNLAYNIKADTQNPFLLVPSCSPIIFNFDKSKID